MKNPSINKASINDFFRTQIFLSIKPTRKRYLIGHKNGCQCEKCIKKWVDEDTYYGRIEAYELSLPEGEVILFINKNIKETTKNDV